METAQPTAPVALQPITYSWLITLQMPVGSGFGVITTDGTIPLAPGDSRTRAYRSIRAALTQQKPELANASVLFFSLEPDQL